MMNEYDYEQGEGSDIKKKRMMVIASAIGLVVIAGSVVAGMMMGGEKPKVQPQNQPEQGLDTGQQNDETAEKPDNGGGENESGASENEVIKEETEAGKPQPKPQPQPQPQPKPDPKPDPKPLTRAEEIGRLLDKYKGYAAGTIKNVKILRVLGLLTYVQTDQGVGLILFRDGRDDEVLAFGKEITDEVWQKLWARGLTENQVHGPMPQRLAYAWAEYFKNARDDDELIKWEKENSFDVRIDRGRFMRVVAKNNKTGAIAHLLLERHPASRRLTVLPIELEEAKWDYYAPRWKKGYILMKEGKVPHEMTYKTAKELGTHKGLSEEMHWMAEAIERDPRFIMVSDKLGWIKGMRIESQDAKGERFVVNFGSGRVELKKKADGFYELVRVIWTKLPIEDPRPIPYPRPIPPRLKS